MQPLEFLTPTKRNLIAALACALLFPLLMEAFYALIHSASHANAIHFSLGLCLGMFLFRCKVTVTDEGLVFSKPAKQQFLFSGEPITFRTAQGFLAFCTTFSSTSYIIQQVIDGKKKSLVVNLNPKDITKLQEIIAEKQQQKLAAYAEEESAATNE